MYGRPLVALMLIATALAGCLQSPSDPVEANAVADGAWAQSLLAVVPETITGLEAASQVEFGAGNDLAFHGDLVFVATHNNGMHIIDASDPVAPVELAVAECSGKDIGVVDLGERVIVTISSQGDDGCPDAAPRGGIRLVDVTNATMPVVLGQVALKYGSHTHTPYGDTGIIYNSAYNLASNPTASPKDHSRSEIVDISDPENPVVAGELMFPATSTSIGCHDILAEPEFDRAICGGITETMIWDTTDPLAPVVKGVLINPLINIHHSVDTARNGTLLIIGDEFGGAAAPACNPSGMAPTGAIWFYTIDGYMFGDLMGFVPPPSGGPGTVCTAHNFNVIEGHDMLVAGFYTAGTLLIDFSEPTAPVVIDNERPTGTSSWASYYYRGVVFSGDGGRGLDIYTLSGEGEHAHEATQHGLLGKLAGVFG